MDTDIRDEIDQSFDEGPPIDDLDLLLARGRAGVRRRRLVEGGSLLLVAGVVAAVAFLPSGSGSSSPDPAGAPSATSAPASPPVVPDAIQPDVVVIVDEPATAGAPAVWFEDDGFVHARSGVEILQTIADPYDRSDIAESAAVVYVRDGTTFWFVGAIQKDGMNYSTDIPARADLTFERWVARSAPVQQTDDGRWPGRTDLDLVEFAAGNTEQLVASSGATILEQRAHPALPDSFATAGDASAVAEVQFEGDRWYVLARQSAGSPPQYIAVSENDGGATLDDFLAMSRERYAEGGGGLL